MASVGRISVLVSKELLTLTQALRQAEPELRKQINKHTRIMVRPVWKEAVLGHTSTRMETRVLGNTANAGVTAQNVMLRSAKTGRVNGIPASSLAMPVEFGANREQYRPVRGKSGTYKRRTMRQFRLPRPRGYVVYPAAKEVIPRIASLWIQTAIRTLHEVIEKGGASRG